MNKPPAQRRRLEDAGAHIEGMEGMEGIEEILTVDITRGRVFVGEREIKLTATEYMILALLAGRPGYVFTFNEILQDVWGDKYANEFQLLSVFMSRLRRKLGDTAKESKFIETRHGTGYMLMKVQNETSK